MGGTLPAPTGDDPLIPTLAEIFGRDPVDALYYFTRQPNNPFAPQQEFAVRRGPLPDPIPLEWMIVARKVNVRPAPSTAGNPLAVLDVGAKVAIAGIVEADGHRWGQIMLGDWAGKWVAREFLRSA